MQIYYVFILQVPFLSYNILLKSLKICILLCILGAFMAGSSSLRLLSVAGAPIVYTQS